MRLGARDNSGPPAEPFPTPFPSLTSEGFRFRRGQVCLVGAGPGVGKSLFAQNLAHRAGVQTLYLSADSDVDDIRLRAIAICNINRPTLEEVDANLASDDWANWYEDNILSKQEHIDWVFDTDINIDRIQLRVQAHAELYGGWPELLVIDNAKDVVDDKSREGEIYEESFAVLKQIARRSRACVVVCAHLEGRYENGDVKPDGLGAFLHKIGKIPEQALLLWRKNGSGDIPTTQLGVMVAKNRRGRNNFDTTLPIDYTRALVDI